MSEIIIKDYCSTCGHQVVFGVACDWQPNICPLTSSAKCGHRAADADQHPVMASPVMPEEFDAILSNN